MVVAMVATDPGVGTIVSVERVAGSGQVQALARRLNDPSRPRIVVVITSAAGTDQPYVDAERVGAEVEGFADVYVMPTGPLSWEFSSLMAPSTEVYGGAARVYPLGVGWIHSPRSSPLHFAFNAADGSRATTRVIGDVFDAVAGSGLQVRSEPLPAARTLAEVMGTPTDTQALARLSNGNYATVFTAPLFPGLAADRVFAKGMRIRGTLRPDGRLDPKGDIPDPRRRLEELRDGEVLPVLIASVEAASCVLTVLPNCQLTLSRDDVTGNPRDDLTDLLTPEEVVLASVRRGPDGMVGLSMLDVDDDVDHRPALSIWPDGPPWLEYAPPQPTTRSVPEQPPAATAPADVVHANVVPADVVPAPPVPAPPAEPVTPGTGRVLPGPSLFGLAPRHAAGQAGPAPGHPAGPAGGHAPEQRQGPAKAPQPPVRGAAVQQLSLSLDAARSEIDRLRGELEQQQADVRAAEQKLKLLTVELDRRNSDMVSLRRAMEHKERQLTELKARHRKSLSAERRGAVPDEGDQFLDPEEQFRWSVYAAWVRRIPAGEKSALPLPEYRIGAQFLASLDAVHGVSRSKVADVVVEVLTGRAMSSASRDVHVLRVGPGGGDEPVRRGDATCWRVSLQTGTPSARRLHYWRDSTGIELSRVVLHDDFTP